MKSSYNRSIFVGYYVGKDFVCCRRYFFVVFLKVLAVDFFYAAFWTVALIFFRIVGKICSHQLRGGVLSFAYALTFGVGMGGDSLCLQCLLTEGGRHFCAYCTYYVVTDRDFQNIAAVNVKDLVGLIGKFKAHSGVLTVKGEFAEH